MTKARQNLKRRISALESAVHASPDVEVQSRLLDERERLVARRGMSAPPFPASQTGGTDGT